MPRWHRSVTGVLTIDNPGIEMDISVLRNKIKASEESHALREPRAKTKPAWAECPTDSPTAVIRTRVRVLPR